MNESDYTYEKITLDDGTIIYSISDKTGHLFHCQNEKSSWDSCGILDAKDKEIERLLTLNEKLQGELAACRKDAKRVARLLAPTEVRMTTPRPKTERVGEKTFLGTILTSQFLSTKKGEQMAFLGLSDDTSMVVFPKKLMLFRLIIDAAIENNQIVFIEAAIMKSGDNTENVLSSIAIVEE